MNICADNQYEKISKTHSYMVVDCCTAVISHALPFAKPKPRINFFHVSLLAFLYHVKTCWKIQVMILVI